jgi:co-chaperonin GroES (HSP10)
VPEITTDFSQNAITIGQACFEAYGDRLIVLQDDYRSGYECPTCLAKDIRMLDSMRQASVVPCDNCAGKGEYEKFGSSVSVKCSPCDGRGVVPCPDCNGVGGRIAISQESERRPTTGTIYSKGSEVTKFERGDRVIYPSFSGHAFDLAGKDINGKDVEAVIVILTERDILARMYGSLSQFDVKRSAALHTAA